jgi:purine-nucleoside phosphorylase
MSDNADTPFANSRYAAGLLREDLEVDSVDVAVVLGSGLSAFAGALDGSRSVEMGPTYRFPAPSVEGHTGTISVGEVGGRTVLVYAGRVHLYEGHPVDRVVHNVRVAAELGARTVVLTNAAGAVNAELEVGTLVRISDHLNLTGANPLVGLASDRTRFVDLSDAYSARIDRIASNLRPGMRSGVYAAFCGPSYETPAEVRMAAAMGADLVGMSTVLETIAARHLGVEVGAFSLVTNRAAGTGPALSHAEVTEVGAAAAGDVVEFLSSLVAEL